MKRSVVAAPLLLVVLRFLQGFALGGEVVGAMVLAMESAPDGRRGRFHGADSGWRGDRLVDGGVGRAFDRATAAGGHVVVGVANSIPAELRTGPRRDLCTDENRGIADFLGGSFCESAGEIPAHYHAETGTKAGADRVSDDDHRVGNVADIHRVRPGVQHPDAGDRSGDPAQWHFPGQHCRDCDEIHSLVGCRTIRDAARSSPAPSSWRCCTSALCSSHCYRPRTRRS